MATPNRQIFPYTPIWMDTPRLSPAGPRDIHEELTADMYRAFKQKRDHTPDNMANPVLAQPVAQRRLGKGGRRGEKIQCLLQDDGSSPRMNNGIKGIGDGAQSHASPIATSYATVSRGGAVGAFGQTAHSRDPHPATQEPLGNSGTQEIGGSQSGEDIISQIMAISSGNQTHVPGNHRSPYGPNTSMQQQDRQHLKRKASGISAGELNPAFLDPRLFPQPLLRGGRIQDDAITNPELGIFYQHGLGWESDQFLKGLSRTISSRPAAIHWSVQLALVRFPAAVPWEWALWASQNFHKFDDFYPRIPSCFDIIHIPEHWVRYPCFGATEEERWDRVASFVTAMFRGVIPDFEGMADSATYLKTQEPWLLRRSG